MVREVLDAVQMKEMERHTIDDIGLSEAILMERAAMAAMKLFSELITSGDRIVIVCGPGNNGGDGLAIARLMWQRGYKVTVYCPVGVKSHEAVRQLEIITKLKVPLCTSFVPEEYTVIIDALFGIGLKRDISGELEELIYSINNADTKVLAVDIPSGIDTDTGRIMGIAVKAAYTVTFGFMKRGILMYPGAEYAGRIHVADIGLDNRYTAYGGERVCYYETPEDCRLAVRKGYSNKGSFGKVLVIAGSHGMTGAACLAAKAAYTSGAGLVKVLTCDEAIAPLRAQLPEAMTACYESKGIFNKDEVSAALEWATVVLAGPGLGRDDTAVCLIKQLLTEIRVPLVLDADGLNILSELAEKWTTKEQHIHGEKKESRTEAIAALLPSGTVLTPHLGELSRLIGLPVNMLAGNLIDIATDCTSGNKLVYVCKDARTVVSEKDNVYINVTGNSGMATGGSGDVLAGFITGLIGTGLSPYHAACTAVYLHGMAGDHAAEKLSEDAVMAQDIAAELPAVIKTARKKGAGSADRGMCNGQKT